MYVIRVEFPDEDQFAYVLCDDGQVKKFNDYEVAKKEAHKYAGVTVIEEREDYEGVHWSI